MASDKPFRIVRKMLEDKGYVLARINGSHHFIRPGRRPFPVPVHNDRVAPAYVRAIEMEE